MDVSELLAARERKKRYLRSYKESVQREKDIIQELEELRMDKMMPSVKMSDGMPKAAGVHRDLSDYIVRLDAMICRLVREKAEKLKRREEIEIKIDAMGDDQEQRVLRLRYIKGLDWEDVSEKMGYSWAHVHRIHNNALDHFENEME